MGQTRKILKISQGKEKVFEVVNEESHQKKTEAQESRIVQVVALASELGLAVALPIAGGAFLGNWLDTKFNLAPRLTLSFIFLGVFLACVNIFFIVREVRPK